jgi:hypothetical protein
MALACPECGQSDGLATVERLFGTCDGEFTLGKDGFVVFTGGGYTDVNWDSTESVGVICRNCGWEFDGEQKYWDTVLIDASKPTPQRVTDLVGASMTIKVNDGPGQYVDLELFQDGVLYVRPISEADGSPTGEQFAVEFDALTSLEEL